MKVSSLVALARPYLNKTQLWGRLKITYNDTLTDKWLDKVDDFIIGNGSGLRILLINHFFDGEIESLTNEVKKRDDVSFISITPEPFFSRALVYFPEEVHNATITYDDPVLGDIRKKYRFFCEKLFHRLYERYQFDCVITPSDSFYWLREFLDVCKEKQITTIVADKEGTISPQSYETEPYRIKVFFPPVSDYFFVWSLRQQSFWLKAGVAADKIFVVGSARTDLFVNLLSEPEKKNILFFDFDTDAYVNNLDWEATCWKGERNWNYLRNATHETLCEIATEFPNVTILIKCHPQQVETDFPAINLSAFDNIKIVKGAPRGIPAMIASSHAVVGFQTTALLEASLTNTPVIYAAWGELYDNVSYKILPWHEDGYGMQWCRSTQELKESLRHILRGESVDYFNKLNRSKLDDYFFDHDGHSASRIIDKAKIVVGKTT